MTPEPALAQKSPRLWPSVLLTLTIATLLSYQWLTRPPTMWFDFRILFLPIYAALGFGILWPFALALQVLVWPSHRQPGLWRYRVAIVLFILCCVGWIPLVRAELAVADRKRTDAIVQEQNRARFATEQAAAEQTLAANGLLAFSEPLHSPQLGVLQQCIKTHDLAPDEFLAAIERYQTPLILNQLAQKPDCPPDALQLLFTKSLARLQTLSDIEASIQLDSIFKTIGNHSNTPVQVLLNMVSSDKILVRMHAVENPRLPHPAKLAYLKAACTYWWAIEIETVAADPDTPVDILTCLSTKQAAAVALSHNPHTPDSVIDQMSESSDFWLSYYGKKALAKRQTKAY
jgi:hypothetical protein